MATHEQAFTPSLVKLKQDIARQEETVAMLRKNGHVSTDAEHQLAMLQEQLRQSL